jgi:hypothetical protein
MLNQMPLFRFEKNQYGAIQVAEYIMRGQRGQYMGEGYIASCLFTIIGLCYLYLANVDRLVASKNQQRVAVIVMIVTLFILQKILLSIYKIKSPWYNPGFAPPDYYLRGSLARDQGNNI